MMMVALLRQQWFNYRLVRCRVIWLVLWSASMRLYTTDYATLLGSSRARFLWAGPFLSFELGG